MLNTFKRRSCWLAAFVQLVFCCVCVAQRESRGGYEQALKAAGASAVVLDVASGNTLRSFGALDVKAAPGSTLKPFVLLTALKSGAAREHQTIACRGTLSIAGHNLACSHPRDITVLDARQALANSCNTYFATVARRMPSATLVGGLRSYGVMPVSVPGDGDRRALLALGMENVVVSPRSLAEAYRKLALAMGSSPDKDARVVADGMVQSVLMGMAHAARVDGVLLGGKTGTVDDGGGRSHGWFAGIVFGGDLPGSARQVLVVFVPNGNGNDAALLAHQILVGRRSLR